MLLGGRKWYLAFISQQAIKVRWYNLGDYLSGSLRWFFAFCLVLFAFSW